MAAVMSKGLGHADLKLIGAPDASSIETLKKTSQCMRIDLSEKEAQDLKTACKDGSTVELALGKAPTLTVGDSSTALHVSPTPSRTEIYNNDNLSPGLEFAGIITHNVVMATSKQQLVGIDIAKERLQANVEVETQKRKDHAGVVSSTPVMKRKSAGAASVLRPNSRPDGLLNAGHSKAASPAMNASHAKPLSALGLAPTSAPARSTAETAITAAKVPTIHLLACRPITSAALSKTIGLPEQDVKPILSKYGKQTSERDEWELSDRSYRELDIWSFKYASAAHRNAAQDNARRAFDRMRTPASDMKIWDKLNAPEDRGKGKCLSKLVLGGPSKGLGISGVAQGVPSDHRRLLAGAGGDPVPRPKSSQSNLGRVMDGKKPLKHSATPKVNGNGASSPLTNKDGTGKGKAKPIVKSVATKKSNGKEYKSAEFIVEDDHELEELVKHDTKSSQPTGSPEKAKQDISGGSSKKRKLTDDGSESKQEHRPSTAAKNDAKRVKLSNGTNSVTASQSVTTSSEKGAKTTTLLTKASGSSNSRPPSIDPKKSTVKAPAKSLDDSKAPSTIKSNDPSKSHKSSKTESTSKPIGISTSIATPWQKQTAPKPPPKHQSNPSSSHSDASRGSTATMEDYRVLQTKYLKAFRTNLHFRLIIYTIPTDLLTAADQKRSDDAAAASEALSDKIKSFLTDCSERELSLLGMNPRDIAKLSKQDKAFARGDDVEPWILLPDHHAQIVDEVVGWREFCKAKTAQLLKEYRGKRTAYEGMDKDNEDGKTEKAWLHERALAIKCLEAINGK